MFIFAELRRMHLSSGERVHEIFHWIAHGTLVNMEVKLRQTRRIQGHTRMRSQRRNCKILLPPPNSHLKGDGVGLHLVLLGDKRVNVSDICFDRLYFMVARIAWIRCVFNQITKFSHFAEWCGSTRWRNEV